MGFLDFLKRRKKKEISEPKKEISLSEIPSYLEEKEKENQNKEEEIFNLISQEINNFEKIIKEKIKLVENFNIEAKKAEDKLRAVTEIGRKKYLESLEFFIEELRNTEKKEFEKFFEKIDRILLNFDKSSRGNYERATVLIGKEMKEIKEEIKNFSKNLRRIFKENEKIIELYRKIFVIKGKLNQINENKKNSEKIKEEIIHLEIKINENKKEIEKTLENIEEIKKSEEYLKNLKAKKRIEILEKDLNENISNLGRLINFKALANFFHIFENSMEIVKAHKENFKIEFEKDYGESILKLLNESKLNNNSIKEKFEKIKNQKKEITELKRNLKEDKIENLLSEIEKIKLEISELNKEKERKNKIEELEEKNKEIEKEIKEDLEDLDLA